MFGITEDEVADLSPKLKEVLSFRYASQMDINVRRSLACTSTGNAPVGANDPHLMCAAFPSSTSRGKVAALRVRHGLDTGAGGSALGAYSLPDRAQQVPQEGQALDTRSGDAGGTPPQAAQVPETQGYCVVLSAAQGVQHPRGRLSRTNRAHASILSTTADRSRDREPMHPHPRRHQHGRRPDCPQHQQQPHNTRNHQ